MAADASRYFDHAATTPADPAVALEMAPYHSEVFGNANSLHSFGREAQAAVDRARERVARAIGAEDPSQIVFTSGATESNNWVLSAFEDVVVGPMEHSSVNETALAQGARFLPNRGETLEASPPCQILSVMRVNNETGTIWDVSALKGGAQCVHSDLTQAVGKVGLSLPGLDFASFSGHKFYGPKGVGALYCKDLPPKPLLHGGEHEQGFRAGTLNVPAIVGMGLAVELAAERRLDDYADAERRSKMLLGGLDRLSDWQANGGSNRSPFILNLSFAGIQGETLVLEADAAGFAISSGAACSSRSTEPSHVLTAMEISTERIRGAVRISFGRSNTDASVEKLLKFLVETVEKLRTMF